MEETQTVSTSGSAVYEHAGFGPRLIAAIIDGVLLGFVTGVINGVLGTAMGLGMSALTTTDGTVDPENTGAFMATLFGSMALMLLINLVITWGYYIILTGMKGATIGKMVMKLEVVDENYQKISYGKAAMREILGKFLSGLVFCLGYLWVLFDDKKQGWHDKIAHTYVVVKKS